VHVLRGLISRYRRLPPGGTTQRRSAKPAAASEPRSATVGAPAPDMCRASSDQARATCTDERAQRGEAQLLICRPDAAGVSAAIAGWLDSVPALTARIAGYTRDRLRRVESAPTARLAY